MLQSYVHAIRDVSRSVSTIPLALLLLSVLQCNPERIRRHTSGSTMGTSYTITYYGGPRTEQLRPDVNALLSSIDRQLSNWNENSWIRRFNDGDGRSPVDVPKHAWRVLRRSLRISRRTNGALDPTLGRLINMWGFGPFDHERPIDDQSRKRALRTTGVDKLTLRKNPPRLSKSHPDLRLNFSATAKGYAIDRIGHLLEKRDVENYKINVGGDLLTSGSPPGRNAWKVSIRRTASDHRERPGQELTLHLTDRAIATTGEYHRFVEVDGEKRPHVLDPETGTPVSTSLTSVSVLAPNCLLADGLATASFVMGEEEARKLLSSMNGVEGLFIHRTSEEEFRIRTTDNWPK